MEKKQTDRQSERQFKAQEWCKGNNTTYHSDEKSGLLRGAPDTRITNDPNCKSSSQTSQTDAETRTELDEAGVQWHDAGYCAVAIVRYN